MELIYSRGMDLAAQEARMRLFEKSLRESGYRHPMKTDLVAGAKFIMVEVDRHLEEDAQWMRRQPIAGMLIKLDTEPVRSIEVHMLVRYRCIMPNCRELYYATLEESLTFGLCRGLHDNKRRWAIKVP